MKSTDIRCPCLRCLFLEQRSKSKRTHQSVSRQFVDLSKALLKKNGKTQRQDSCAKPVTTKEKKKKKKKLLHYFQSLHTNLRNIQEQQQQRKMAREYHSSDCQYFSNEPTIKKKKKERTCLGSCQDTGGVSSNFTRVYRYIRRRQHYYMLPFPPSNTLSCLAVI